MPTFALANEKLRHWPIEIPTPDTAGNPESTFDDRFQTIAVTFDWVGNDARELYEFYNTYFSSLGWEDPTAQFSNFPKSKTGWSSYGMTFDENNRPSARYASMWKSTSIPAISNVSLQLNSYESDTFRGQVIVHVTPEIDMTPLFRLNSLLGEDPKNWFLLHNAVQGNPLDLTTISLPPSYRDETKPLFAEYYSIVDEITEAFSDWKEKYVSN